MHPQGRKLKFLVAILVARECTPRARTQNLGGGLNIGRGISSKCTLSARTEILYWAGRKWGG